jgi:type VI secretion system protein ImpF
LDRLIDDEPKNRSEVPLTRAQSLWRMKAAVRRDLEWLLNSRRTIDPAPESARETVRSVYHYGFSDISSKSVLSSRDQNDLIRDMELTLAVFETRLKRARVRLEPVQGGVRALRFVIEGLLCMDPAPEPVAFDTLLELGKGEYEVRGEDGAR